jgi:YVTN family beta-propeller protein
MRNLIRRNTVAGFVAAATLATMAVGLEAQGVKIADPTSVVMIVNRDSNDIAFMDIKTKEILGRTFLGNNVNPHMVMMSPDGRYVVTGGQRSNTAYIIDSHTLELVAKIPVGFAPEHLAFSPDGRWYYQGNPEGDSITVIDMQSLKAIKTITGLAEPLNITFTPDGSKAYIGNYGAHWVGVVDVTRHELIKKIQVDATPGITRLDPSKYLTEIKGIFNATPTPDGRFLYAADGDLGVVGVIDTREDKVVKVIRVGPDPWRTYMSHDGKYALSANNGDGTVSFIDTAKNAVVATYPAGQDLTGINYAAGKAFVISSTTGFIYVFDMKTLKPAGRIKIGNNLFLQTATTDVADQKLYLGSATDNSIYIIDGQTEAVERVANVGQFPWGTHIMDSKDNYCH